MSLLCRLGFHKWVMRPPTTHEHRRFPYLAQRIACKRCGITK